MDAVPCIMLHICKMVEYMSHVCDIYVDLVRVITCFWKQMIDFAISKLELTLMRKLLTNKFSLKSNNLRHANIPLFLTVYGKDPAFRPFGQYQCKVFR